MLQCEFPDIFRNKKIQELKDNGNLAARAQHSSHVPVIESLLKNIYSKSNSDKNLGQILENLYYKHPILKQVLTAAEQYSNVPIFLVNNITEEFDFTDKSRGYYSYKPNFIVVGWCGEFNNINCLRTIIHELSHMVIDKTFNNGAQPYYDLPSPSFPALSSFSNKLLGYYQANQYDYETAVLETLKNIAYQLELPFKKYNHYTNHTKLGTYLWDNHCSYSITNNENCYYGYKKILDSYDQEFYNTNRKHNIEIIVRLPELLAYYECDNAAIEAMEPLQDYWELYIVPELTQIQKQLPTTTEL